jgi:hypothetical protein
MYKVKKIGALSLAKILGALYAAMGFIFGLMFAVFSIIPGLISLFVKNGQGAALVAVAMGMGAIIVLPLFYGAIGFIAGLIASVIYNFVASKVGGIELDLEG